MKKIIIKSGELFLATSGEYSDYSVHTLCRALQDIDVGQLREEYLQLYPNQSRDYEFETFQFIKWITADKKVADEVEYREWYLGAYGEANFSLS